MLLLFCFVFRSQRNVQDCGLTQSSKSHGRARTTCSLDGRRCRSCLLRHEAGVVPTRHSSHADRRHRPPPTLLISLWHIIILNRILPGSIPPHMSSALSPRPPPFINVIFSSLPHREQKTPSNILLDFSIRM